jgi:hypothetical protein
VHRVLLVDCWVSTGIVAVGVVVVDIVAAVAAVAAVVAAAAGVLFGDCLC